MHGRTLPQPPQRSTTLSSMYRSLTGKKDKTPEIERKPVYIPKYELEWDKLKAWLDTRYEGYGYTFTERFDVSGDKYVVHLPHELTEDDEIEIAKLKKPRT